MSEQEIDALLAKHFKDLEELRKLREDIENKEHFKCRCIDNLRELKSSHQLIGEKPF